MKLVEAEGILYSVLSLLSMVGISIIGSTIDDALKPITIVAFLIMFCVANLGILVWTTPLTEEQMNQWE